MISKRTLTNLYNASPTWEEIPEFLTTLRERAAAFADLTAEDMPHALITEYSPGTGTKASSATWSASRSSPPVSSGSGARPAPHGSAVHRPPSRARRIYSVEPRAPTGSTAFPPWRRFATRSPSGACGQSTDNDEQPEETLGPGGWYYMRALGHPMLDDAFGSFETVQNWSYEL